MKKLCLMAAAVVFAAGVHGSSVQWGGAISEPDGVTALAAGTQAFLVWSEAAFSGTGAEFDGTSLSSGGTKVASMVDSYTISGTEAGNWSFSRTYDKSGSGVDGYYAVLIGNAATDPTKYSFYDLGQISGTKADTAPQDLSVDWSDGYLTSGGYTVSAATAGGSIPEPTSGLLMLIGMAGLALRRRRA